MAFEFGVTEPTKSKTSTSLAFPQMAPYANPMLQAMFSGAGLNFTPAQEAIYRDVYSDPQKSKYFSYANMWTPPSLRNSRELVQPAIPLSLTPGTNPFAGINYPQAYGLPSLPTQGQFNFQGLPEYNPTQGQFDFQGFNQPRSFLPQAGQFNFQGLQSYASDVPSEDALFGLTSKRLLEGIRPGMAARGMLTSGVGQDVENQALSELATTFGANAFERGMQRANYLTGIDATSEQFRQAQEAQRYGQQESIGNLMLSQDQLGLAAADRAEQLRQSQEAQRFGQQTDYSKLLMDRGLLSEQLRQAQEAQRFGQGESLFNLGMAGQQQQFGQQAMGADWQKQNIMDQQAMWAQILGLITNQPTLQSSSTKGGGGFNLGFK